MNREEELILFRKTLNIISPIKNNAVNHFNVNRNDKEVVEEVAILNQNQGRSTLEKYIEKEGVKLFGKDL